MRATRVCFERASDATTTVVEPPAGHNLPASAATVRQPASGAIRSGRLATGNYLYRWNDPLWGLRLPAGDR